MQGIATAWKILYGEDYKSIPDPNQPENTAHLNALKKAERDALERFLNGQGKVLVDTTFTFVSPPDCSVSPATPVTVPDKWLEDFRVSITRSWLANCIEPGAHTFTADVTVALDPSELVADPDTTNNSASGSDTTEIGS